MTMHTANRAARGKGYRNREERSDTSDYKHDDTRITMNSTFSANKVDF